MLSVELPPLGALNFMQTVRELTITHANNKCSTTIPPAKSDTAGEITFTIYCYTMYTPHANKN